MSPTRFILPRAIAAIPEVGIGSTCATVIRAARDRGLPGERTFGYGTAKITGRVRLDPVADRLAKGETP